MFQEARGREMQEEEGGWGGVGGGATGDIDKDGRCRGACLGVMQLYDALFHLA